MTQNKYRDFIYLDTDRIQSIIAQLQQGVLEKVIEGKSNELQGKAGVAAGVLASLLPVELGGNVVRQQSIEASKVLHDYAFNIALDSLMENDLCIEVEAWQRENLPLPETAFVLIQGKMSILDYALLKSLAENEGFLDSFFTPAQEQPSSKQQYARKKRSKRRNTQTGTIKQMWQFVEAFMGDSLQVQFDCHDQLVFIGPLTREYLRENTRNLIFKYGGKPRSGWKMLAQICQITEPSNKSIFLENRLSSMFGTSEKDQQPNIATASEGLDMVVEVLNSLQEIIASVSYPAIAVTPIAIYRELENLR